MQLDKASYKAKYGTSSFVFVDNTTGEISEGDFRTFGEDQGDSVMFLSDHFIDEDNMATNSAVKAPSQQSVKAYVDGAIDPGFKSTGVTGGTGVSINADTTKFDINVQGQIVNPTTFAVTTINVNQTAIAVTNLSQKVTYVGIDASSTVIQQADPFTTEQLFSLLGEFVLVHTNGTSLNAVNNFPNIRFSVIEQLHAHMRNLGMTNLRGNVVTANGANLRIDKSTGVIERVGVGAYDADNPNEKSLTALTAATFRYRNQNSAEGSDTQDLDVTNYDVAGTTTAMSNNKFKVDRVALFSSNLVRIQRGQHQYDTLAQAIDGITSDSYVLEDNISDNGVIIAYIVVKKSISNLTDAITSNEAKIISANRFGATSGGGANATGEIPIEAFTQTLQFNVDKELAFNNGGTLSFTLSSSGNVNGKGVMLKLNNPTSVAFSSDFQAMDNSNTFDSGKMNLVTLVFFDNYDGAGGNKVIYQNNQLPSV